MTWERFFVFERAAAIAMHRRCVGRVSGIASRGARLRAILDRIAATAAARARLVAVLARGAGRGAA